MGGRQDTAFLKGPYFKKNDNGGVLQKMRVGGFDHPIRGRQKNIFWNITVRKSTISILSLYSTYVVVVVWWPDDRIRKRPKEVALYVEYNLYSELYMIGYGTEKNYL